MKTCIIVEAQIQVWCYANSIVGSSIKHAKTN